MAHFAEIDENNIVVRVLVVDDLYESDGHNYLANTLGLGGTWLKTSYNTRGGQHFAEGTPFRKNFAGIGMTYDLEKDAFIEPQPYPSWVLNDETCIWEAPTPSPTGDVIHIWNEATLAWEEAAVPVI